MRRMILAALLSASASAAIAAPTTKQQLLLPPAARVITPSARPPVSMATSGRGRCPTVAIAYRMSMSLRGWITEDDAADHARRRRAADGDRHSRLYRPGRCDRRFQRRRNGVAHWKTSVDFGSAPFGRQALQHLRRPWLAGEKDVEALVAAGDKGIDLLPNGHASDQHRPDASRSTGRKGPSRSSSPSSKASASAVPGLARRRQPLFRQRRASSRCFPKATRRPGPKLKDIQDEATAAMVRDVAHRSSSPRTGRRPWSTMS